MNSKIAAGIKQTVLTTEYDFNSQTVNFKVTNGDIAISIPMCDIVAICEDIKPSFDLIKIDAQKRKVTVKYIPV